MTAGLGGVAITAGATSVVGADKGLGEGNGGTGAA